MAAFSTSTANHFLLLVVSVCIDPRNRPPSERADSSASSDRCAPWEFNDVLLSHTAGESDTFAPPVFTANSVRTGEHPGASQVTLGNVRPVWIKHSLLVVCFHRLINSNYTPGRKDIRMEDRLWSSGPFFSGRFLPEWSDPEVSADIIRSGLHLCLFNSSSRGIKKEACFLKGNEIGNETVHRNKPSKRA